MIAFWAYPAVVLAGWLLFALWTLPALTTIQHGTAPSADSFVAERAG